jgi:hypothetical protein
MTDIEQLFPNLNVAFVDGALVFDNLEEKSFKPFTDYIKERRKTDINFKLYTTVSSYICAYVKKAGAVKQANTIKLLGCTVEEYKEYLESRFESWMSWDNFGKISKKGPQRWNIDHIIPTSHFDLRDPIQQMQAFHYKNTRPFEARRNISEGNRRPRQERYTQNDSN